MVDRMKGKAVKRNTVREADVSIDTSILDNGVRELSYVENKLKKYIEVSRHFDKLDSVKIDTTPKGNLHITVDGSDLLTLSGSLFSENELFELKDLGYFTNPTFDSEDDSDELDREFEEGVSLEEAEVPASQLDFKHQQLAKVQEDIKIISELKAEDTSNELYTQLLDVYDKIVSIITDSIAEDPVGTVIDNQSDTGLTIDTEISSKEEPAEDLSSEEPVEEL